MKDMRFFIIFIIFLIRPAVVHCGTDLVWREFSGPFCTDSFVNPADSIILFDMELIDFGEMTQGEVLSVQFAFLNAGKDSLEIDLVSACDCMDVEWTEQPVAPGGRGIVEILFDTKDNPGEQKKDIDLIFKNTDARGYPLVRRAVLKGRVVPK
jgi:hypothetical protein